MQPEQRYFRAYDAPALPAPAELARHLVFGAIAYARDLGFEPAPDFEECAGHLGPWAGPSAIGFGRDGKPLYIQGPYADAAAVMTTLGRCTSRGDMSSLVTHNIRRTLGPDRTDRHSHPGVGRCAARVCR